MLSGPTPSACLPSGVAVNARLKTLDAAKSGIDRSADFNSRHRQSLISIHVTVSTQNRGDSRSYQIQMQPQVVVLFHVTQGDAQLSDLLLQDI